MTQASNKRSKASNSRGRSAASITSLTVSPMKSLGLVQASKKLEGIRFDKTRELTPAERALWGRAKRGRGRPKKPAEERVARVLVSIAPDLLAAADAYAQRQRISRAELFARGLQAVLPRRA
jgi:hypothetical protein